MPGGYNLTPDFCMDSKGVIYCVWVHLYETNYSKVFFSKSVDHGFSWTTPENVSLNSNFRLANPHIACDSNDVLHLVYDFDISNYTQTQIHYKSFENNMWSATTLLSENMPGSHDNKLLIDYNNRIYVFWFCNENNGTSFYLYNDNQEWSEIFSPYPGNFYLAISRIECDFENKLHCVGAFHEEGQTHYMNRIFYSNYEPYENLWSSISLISNITYGYDIVDVSTDQFMFPHVAYRQKTPLTLPGYDSTMYVFNSSIGWSQPEMVVEDPEKQRIVVDDNNNVHIVHMEKLENGTQLVHYRKIDDIWQGYIIVNDDYNSDGELKLFEDQLMLFFRKTSYDLGENYSEILFSKTDISTGNIDFPETVSEFKFFPNPFYDHVFVTFILKNSANICLDVFNFQGRNIVSLIDKKQPPGRYEIKWNGTDQNGKEVKNGVYLIRLQAGRQIMTRSVVYHR